MDYSQTLKYLYNSLPVFQRIGAAAYKANLNNTEALDAHLGFPHRSFATVHIAGTNGKGSTSQMIYGVLRAHGLKVGLYTSPHLRDFRERIVVDDQMIGCENVVRFVEENREFIDQLKPSFFEVTVAMAFDYFRRCEVDVAVVEVGMGGRLDSTNVITPELSVITNIAFDHMQFLGSTLPQIASEKAGIIKAGVPVVIGESNPEYDSVFAAKAAELGAPLTVADARYRCVGQRDMSQGSVFTVLDVQSGLQRDYHLGMSGEYQGRNLCTALAALDALRARFSLAERDVEQGLCGAVVAGRWQVLGRDPLVVCDTGHNRAGLEWVVRQIARQSYEKLYFVMGVVSDKDLSSILDLLPRDAYYIFTQADIERAMPYCDLQETAMAAGLRGEGVSSVAGALDRARELATPRDMIFVGGSTFTVAEIL